MTVRQWLQLLGLAALWGSSYMFISLALEGFHPTVLVLGRVGIAALLVLPILIHRRASMAGHWHRLPITAFFQVALPFTLISIAEQQISSGLAGILVATQPLWLVVLGPALALGWPSLRAAAGTLVGLAGVTILLGGIGTSGSVNLPYALMVVSAAASYAIGVALVRRWMRGVNAVALTGATMGMATLLVWPVAVWFLPDQWPGTGAIGALVMLASACTAGAFVLFNRLIAEAGPARASLVSYLAPGFAVTYGAILLAEPVGPGTFVGLVLIVAGSWLCGAKRRRDTQSAARPTTGPATVPTQATREDARADELATVPVPEPTAQGTADGRQPVA